MYNILLSTIQRGGYKLSEILNKIETMWVAGKLTDEERNTLIEQARNHATPESEYAPLMEQINDAFEEIEALKARVEALEQSGSEEPEEPTEEYPEYVQPTGAHDAYKIGDKISYNGKKYICQRDGCVWNPDDLPSAWQEVTEESKDSE